MGAAALAVGWRLAPRHSSTRIPSAVVDAQSLSADHLLGFMRHDSAVVSVLAMLAKRPGPSSRRLRRKPATSSREAGFSQSESRHIGWARHRGMRLDRLHPGPDASWCAAIEGFGAWSILRKEAGLHSRTEGGRGDTATAYPHRPALPASPHSTRARQGLELANRSARSGDARALRHHWELGALRISLLPWK